MNKQVQREELGLVYEMTPATPFSPRDARKQRKNVVYKIGSVMPLTESMTMEYKAGGGNYPLNILATHIQKYGSAFLNSNGGTLCVGVTDDGIVVGVRLSWREQQRVSSIIEEEFKHFTPSVGPDMYEVSFVSCNKLDHYVIEVHVRCGDAAEIYSDRNNKMWMKRDGSVQFLWPQEIRKIVIAKFEKELLDANEKGTSSRDSNAFPLMSLSTATPVVYHRPT